MFIIELISSFELFLYSGEIQFNPENFLSILYSKKPDIYLTLSDGEPSDTSAARSMVKSFKSLGIKMVAIGVGRDTRNATIIATNLKYLGFERTLGVSRLKDIPNKVLNVLSDV